MPNKLKVKSCILSLVASVVPAMFLVCKFQEYKRQQQEQNKRKTAERELSNLNHKIDKLLIKLEEHEPELAASPDDECVICISAKATMQTFPCGHRVVCRKCFVKTIQVAVSQRLLPLRCVICRAKILRLKQTTHGGIDTGTVLRSRGAIASSSSSASSSNVPNNPFYLSPATSPVSPVTEVFREQRAVWVRNYDSFGYTSAGQSPSITPTTPVSPLTSTASAATPTTPPEGLAKTDQSLRSGCVLHKHCFGKHKLRNNSPNVSPITQSPSSSFSSSFSSTSSSSSSSPSTAVKTPITSLLSSIQTGATASSGLHSKPVNKLSTTPTHHHRCTSNPWQWQFNRKKRHRLAHRRRHGNHFGGAGRPNSLLLPIDERDEFQDILSGRASQASDRENGKNNGIKCQKSATIAEPEDFDDTRMPEDSAVVTDSDQYENVSPKDEARAILPSGGALRLSSSDTQMDKLSSDEESESVKSYESAKNISRKSSVSGLLSPPRRKPMKNGSISLTLASSKIGTTFLKAKNLMSRGKWSIY